MKLIPLQNLTDNEEMTISKLILIKEVSQEQFAKEYAVNPLAATVDGESSITVYSGNQPMEGWFLVE